MNAWRGDEKAHVIEVADLLPWVAKAQKKILHEKARGAPIKQAESIKPAESIRPKPAESAVDKAVKKYVLLKGINLDDLTPEELADVTADAINNDAGGIFGKAPVGWHFPTEPTTEVVK